MSSYRQSCDLVLKELSMQGEVPENVNELIAGSDQDLELFDKDTASLNVVDVYQIAASIGREFERLTDMFGGVAFSGAMPKIIRILEMFEQLVKLREERDTKISSISQELTAMDNKLKMRNITEAREMDKFHTAWEDSVKELKRKNRQMEEDNKRLLAIVSDQNEKSVTEEDFVQHMQNMSELQTKIEDLKEENRGKSRLINEHAGDCEALQSQVDRLAKINSDLRQKVSILQQQATSLINEKSALESKLNSKLGFRYVTKKEAAKVEEEPSLRKENVQEKVEGQTNETTMTRTESIDDPLLANKLVIDLNDPNRPRYTLQELLEVLNDKNTLKARCFRLEEELIFYKDVSRSMGYVDESWEEINARELRQYNTRLFVNPEPETNETSGIRRFFTYLTSDLFGKRGPESSPITSANRSPQPIRRTKPSTYHEAKDKLVSEDEVSNLAPRLLLESSSQGDDIIVRSSSEMLPLSKYIEEEEKGVASSSNHGDDDDDIETDSGSEADGQDSDHAPQ